MVASLALKEKGNACFALRQFEQAVQWYSRAMEEAPGAAALLTNRAAALSELGRWEEALRDARRSLELQPGWVKARGDCAELSLWLVAPSSS